MRARMTIRSAWCRLTLRHEVVRVFPEIPNSTIKVCSNCGEMHVGELTMWPDHIEEVPQWIRDGGQP